MPKKKTAKKTKAGARSRAREARTNGRVNLNFKVDQATKDLLASLQERTRAPSETQVIRNALALLEKYANAKDAGGSMLIDGGNGAGPVRVEFL